MASVTELGELQLAVLQLLWRTKESSAAEVHAALSEDRDVAITTVSTILTRLDRRGLIKHRAEGRTFIYRAAISEPDVRRSMLGSMVSSLFSGDPAAVVSQLLSDRDISPGDVERMHALIAEARSKPRRKS
jgi:predicted transcriptional regulator